VKKKGVLTTDHLNLHTQPPCIHQLSLGIARNLRLDGWSSDDKPETASGTCQGTSIRSLLLAFSGMRTMAVPEDAQSIIERMKKLCPEDAARWGRMNAHQMLRHLGEAMQVPLGEIEVSVADVPELQRKAFKWAALYVPLKWRRNFPTRPEIDQCFLNPYLNDFETDRESAIALARRLLDADLDGKRHPYFWTMTRAEWLRWGWLHADHHLRQFGR